MGFYVNGGGGRSIAAERVKPQPKSTNLKIKLRGSSPSTTAGSKYSPHPKKPRVGSQSRERNAGRNYSPAEAESAFGSSSSSPLGMPSLVDSTSRSRRNSSSAGAVGSEQGRADPGAEAAPGAPAAGAANSLGTSWSFSAKSSVSGLEESEWPVAGE